MEKLPYGLFECRNGRGKENNYRQRENEKELTMKKMWFAAFLAAAVVLTAGCFTSVADDLDETGGTSQPSGGGTGTAGGTGTEGETGQPSEDGSDSSNVETREVSSDALADAIRNLAGTEAVTFIVHGNANRNFFDEARDALVKLLETGPNIRVTLDLSGVDGLKEVPSHAFISTAQSCTNLAGIVLPNGVTSIEQGAFRNCSNLTSVTIPSSVTFIADIAFGWCSNLKDVYYGGSKTEWNEIYFYSSVSSLGTGLKDKTITGADGTTWTHTGN